MPTVRNVDDKGRKTYETKCEVCGEWFVTKCYLVRWCKDVCHVLFVKRMEDEWNERSHRMPKPKVLHA